MDSAVETVAWDDGELERRGKKPSIPILHLDGFDGPMDLLLDLAERQLIDLGKMSILELAVQFVAALEELAAVVAIERRADWLVLATRLVVLRTRLLFPKNPEEAADAAREADAELQRLNELARMRAAANWLSRRPYLGFDVFAHPQPKEGRESGYVAMMEACLLVLRGRPGSDEFEPPASYRVAVPDLWRIPDAIERVRNMLPEFPEGARLGAFLPEITRDAERRPLKLRAAIASTFAASLELARQQVAVVEQAAIF